MQKWKKKSKLTTFMLDTFFAAFALNAMHFNVSMCVCVCVSWKVSLHCYLVVISCCSIFVDFTDFLCFFANYFLIAFFLFNDDQRVLLHDIISGFRIFSCIVICCVLQLNRSRVTKALPRVYFLLFEHTSTASLSAQFSQRITHICVHFL